MPADCLIVFGALRSGTTMLRLMLDAHPHLACTGEHDFLFDHLHGDAESWTYDRDTLSTDRIFIASGLAIPQENDGVAALHVFIDQIRQQGDGLPVLMLHRNLGKVLAVLSGAPVVHFLRDPRDVAKSGIGMMWAGNVFYGVDTWLHTEGEWEREGHGLDDQVLTIRYEDLVESPRDTLGAICRHVDISFDDRMLSYPETTTYSAPDPSLANQWKKRLSEKEIRLVEFKAGPIMSKRGYKASSLPPIRLSVFGRTELWLQNKFSIWIRMVRVYGVTPLLERSLGRRMKLRSIELRGQMKMDHITRAQLK